MDILFHFSVPLISSLIVISIIIIFYYYGRKSKFQPDFTNAVPVIEVLKSLTKICPINSFNKWLLLPFDYGLHRCWKQNFSLPVMNKNVILHGSAAILSSSSVSIGSLVADITKWSDWNPFYSSQFIVKSFHDKQLKRDHYMEAEQIVSIVREANKIHSHTFMYRLHDISENKVGWILFWHAKKLEFLFFLIQPVKNKNENPQCVLTHIMGTESNMPSPASLVLQRMRNIQDLLALSSVTLAPLKFTSSLQSSASESSSQIETPSSSSSQENFFSLPVARARKRDVRHTMYILVPFESSADWLWRKEKGFKLGVKNMDDVPESKFQKNIAKQEHIASSQNKSLLKRPMRRSISDVNLKPQILINLSKQSKKEITVKKYNLGVANEKSSSDSKEEPAKKQISDTTTEDSETKCNTKTVHHLGNEVKDKIHPRVKLRSFSETALDNSDVSEAQNKRNCESLSKLQHIEENAEDRVLAVHDQDQNEIFSYSVSDFEVVECCEYTENKIAGFMTQGNYGASELQAEVLLASQLEVWTRFEHGVDSSNAGRWMFHSNHKGLSVLTKSTSNQFLRISSFLCQTDLPVSPKDVWKFVKNPQFRFICDETVKSVEVLEKISTSQKLIHTYHEVGGLLKKELMDFCLLQTEREELNKYYSCFYSIEFDKCPFMKSVTRGTLRPSGWIVEESDEGEGKSKVTYMIQILINSPDSLLIHELSTLVPQSVHNLKNYITSKPV